MITTSRCKGMVTGYGFYVVLSATRELLSHCEIKEPGIQEPSKFSVTSQSSSGTGQNLYTTTYEKKHSTLSPSAAGSISITSFIFMLSYTVPNTQQQISKQKQTGKEEDMESITCKTMLL